MLATYFVLLVNTVRAAGIRACRWRFVLQPCIGTLWNAVDRQVETQLVRRRLGDDKLQRYLSSATFSGYTAAIISVVSHDSSIRTARTR